MHLRGVCSAEKPAVAIFLCSLCLYYSPTARTTQCRMCSVAHWFVFKTPVQRHAARSVIGHKIANGTGTGSRGFGHSSRSRRGRCLTDSTSTGEASGLMPGKTRRDRRRGAGPGRRLVRPTSMGRSSCLHAGVHSDARCV